MSHRTGGRAAPADDLRARLAMPGRRISRLLALLFLAMAVIVFPDSTAYAAPTDSVCTVNEWQSDPSGCADKLTAISTARAECVEAPPPDTPDSGIGGWFATEPDSARHPGVTGMYSEFGYAGYSYTTYDIGCVQTLMHPDYKFENTVANGEFLIATSVIGSSNALRERAWDPGIMWKWADPLVQKATQSIYTQVFTVFGVISLAIVGLYLIWRSRQARLSSAMTTAGWAILVMVVVTALASWPVFSAHLADNALVTSLNTVDKAVGPPSQTTPADQCPFADKAACVDSRPAAVRASDTAVQTILYRDWLRGLLGSADSPTAIKYGPALYDARALNWTETADFRSTTAARQDVITQKAAQWERVAEQIRTEDPEAYQYLQGTKGLERIGAGFVAMLSSILFGFFDITASVLILLGFLLFRWAVIAAPLVGTVAIMRPASAGFRRLANAVVAALFNIVIFGTGAAIYLFAVDLIMSTASLPGWLQVVLIGLCGVAGWMLLRPYRRITQLTGGTSPAAAALASKRREADEAAVRGTIDAANRPFDQSPQRVELRPESPTEVPVRTAVPSPAPTRRIAVPAGAGWAEPELEPASPVAIYRPSRSLDSAPRAEARPAQRSMARAEARRDA